MNNLHYFQIPLAVGYHLKLENNKWFILPQLEITPCILISKVKNTQLESARNMVFFGGVAVSIGHHLSEKLSLLTTFQFQRSITSLFQQIPKSHISTNNLGILLAYKLQ